MRAINSVAAGINAVVVAEVLEEIGAYPSSQGSSSVRNPQVMPRVPVDGARWLPVTHDLV